MISCFDELFMEDMRRDEAFAPIWERDERLEEEELATKMLAEEDLEED